MCTTWRSIEKFCIFAHTVCSNFGVILLISSYFYKQYQSIVLCKGPCAFCEVYRIFLNLIRTSFCRFLKRKKKKLVRCSNPHLSFNRPLRAAPSEVARWVSAAGKAIPESIIVRSFKKCCISNALDWSEDDILWEDDGEDKDDSDWVTDNDWVMSDDGESEE